MEFSFGNATIVLPSLYITIIGIIIIFLLVRWSKQLETRRFTVFIYFLICTTIMPIYSYGTTEGVFQLFNRIYGGFPLFISKQKLSFF